MSKLSLMKELTILKKKYVKLRAQYTKATDGRTKELLRREIDAVVSRARDIRAILGKEVKK